MPPKKKKRTTKEQPPLPLWQFAKQVSPCRWRAYNRWHNITKETLTRVSVRVAEAAIKKHCGPDGTWATPIEIDKAYERRAALMRFRVKYLLGFYLPEKVRNALLTGKYKVTAHLQDGSLVTLTSATLAGLDVDLMNSRLSSPSSSYSDVSVTVLRQGRGRQKGVGKFDDMLHFEKMKALIDEKEAKSPNDAANRIADSVTGASFAAKVDRLLRGYKDWEKSGFPRQV